MNAKDLNIDQHSVHDVMLSINPPWEKLIQWFSWPPDLFLLTSLLLKKTGAYRSVLTDSRWKTNDFLDVDKHSRDWLKAIQVSLVDGSPLKLTREIEDLCNRLDDGMKAVKFTELKVLNTPQSRDLSLLLVHAHALADQAGESFGIPRACDKEIALVHCLANLLLVTRGSLASIPKFHGVILPKMRTPQTGLTLRSFSQQMSYQDSEVEVMWRSVPWMNKDQNSMNIICVPWPVRIDASDFKNQPETFESVRYFSYHDEKKLEDQIGKLVSSIKKQNDEYNIHVIAFPELALRLTDYNYLLSILKQEYDEGRLKYMPMVISGVNVSPEELDPSQGDSHLPRNTVRLAIYFAGKWYDMSQTKHHRWKLTRNQLIQYELSGRFSTERNWFERVDIEQRRLSFFVPNGWLALCPLICEDLAQLEPVSEIIRSSGPTLLIALLMDGPQIKERWPARYASIFADDPGTAVLTMTSLGMVDRSIGLSDGQNIQSSFALWKDQIKGWRNVDLGLASHRKGTTAVLSVSASFTEEYSADGRSDGGYASVFKLDNIYYPEDSSETIELKGKRVKTSSDSIWFGDWTDLRELSSMNYAIDTLISLQGNHWNLIRSWLLPPEKRPKSSHHYSFIISLLLGSYDDSSSVGINSGQSNAPTESLKQILKEIDECSIFADWKNVSWKDDSSKPDHVIFKKRLQYWDDLYDKAVKELKKINMDLISLTDEDQDKIRVQRALYLAVLMSLHNRVDDFRTKYRNRNYDNASSLFQKIEDAITEFSRFK